jgi:hypothetical protein
MSSLVNGHESDVTRALTGRTDVTVILLVGGDEGSGGTVGESGLVRCLKCVKPVLRRRSVSVIRIL